MMMAVLCCCCSKDSSLLLVLLTADTSLASLAGGSEGGVLNFGTCVRMLDHTRSVICPGGTPGRNDCRFGLVSIYEGLK